AVLDDVDDSALGADDAPAFGHSAEVGGVERGVELERVGDARQRRVRLVGARVEEAAVEARNHAERIVVQRRWIAERLALEPEMMEVDPEHVEAVVAERMDVAVADVRPVAELDAELVGGVGGPDEVAFVEADQLVEQGDLRNGRFADPDRADLLGFDELDPETRHGAENLGHGDRAHPAGGAAADDHDLSDEVVPHSANSRAAGGGVAAQQLAMNSACEGRRWAMSAKPARICSSAWAILFSSRPSTTGLYSSGTTCWPSITATQLTVLNSSRPSANTRPLLRNWSIF